MRIRITVGLVALAAVVLPGCGGSRQPDFGDLNPVTGVVKRGGTTVNGGVVTFIQEPDKGEFLVNCEVKPDGTYALTTVRLTDSKGERKPGAAAGSYKVSYVPPLGDQAAGASTEPVQLPKPVTVKPGPNDIPLEFPKK